MEDFWLRVSRCFARHLGGGSAEIMGTKDVGASGREDLGSGMEDLGDIEEGSEVGRCSWPWTMPWNLCGGRLRVGR